MISRPSTFVKLAKFYSAIVLLVIALTGCSSKGDWLIDGYTDKMSYAPGEDCDLYLNSDKTTEQTLTLYTIDNKKVEEINVTPSSQRIANEAAWENGYGYEKTTSIQIPEVKSGIYLFNKKIPIIIKGKTPSPITIVYPSNTINAYNNAGGKSLYGFNSSDKEKANIISFNRPQPLGDRYADSLFYKWIASETEANYIVDKDLEDLSNFGESKVLVIVGHNEYWTKKARQNFDQFIADGGNALVLSGNSMYWQMRYQEPNHQIVCYKDFESDPISDTLDKTIKWTDTLLDYQTYESIGADFNRGGYGKKDDDGWDGFKVISASSPIFKGTDLKEGDIIPMPTTEYDGAPTLLADINSIPEIDTFTLGFYRVELVAYDLGYTNHTTVGTFMVFQKFPYSGKVINVCSTEWCSKQTFNNSETLPLIKKLTLNMINLLENDLEVFSTP